MEEDHGRHALSDRRRDPQRAHHGENDHEETINDHAFTPTCRHVVFTFGVDHVWTVDTTTGEVGPLLAGSQAVIDQHSTRVDDRERETSNAG
jgi:hypothetical protein